MPKVRRCARPGCRTPKAEGYSYCAFHRAEYQREYRASHPRTPQQVANDRQRNRRNKRLAKARKLKALKEAQVTIPVTVEKPKPFQRLRQLFGFKTQD